jgi:signal transduction histidine kinase
MAPLAALRQLVDSDSEEDRILSEVEYPPVYETGRRFVALAIVGLGVILTLAFRDDGDDRVTVALITIPVLPWVLEFKGIHLPRLWRCVVVLVPSALVLVMTLLDVVGRDDGTTPVGAEVALFVIFLLMADFWDAPRRDLAVAIPALYVIPLSRFTGAGELVNTVIWCFALTFMVVAMMGLRFGAIAMTRAKEALAVETMNEDRRRIARDIHDVVAHTLAVTMLHVTAARMAVHRSAPGDALEALEEAEAHGRASLTDVRRIVRLLRSEESTALAFAQPDLESLPELVAHYRAAGLPVELQVQGATDQVAPVTSLTLYRVVQEALANAARHGHGPARVYLRIVDGSVVLSVCNAGGQARTRRSRGSGLLGMQERVMAAGGSLDTGPTENGWALRVNVPVRGPAPPPTPVPT